MRGSVSKIALLGFGAGLALAAGTFSASATTFYSDGNFNNVTLAPVYQSGASTFTTNVPCASCGESGGAGFEAIINTNGAGGSTTTAIGGIENLFSYNPLTQGVIATINASADKRVVFTGTPAVYTNVFHPLILQGGNYYLATIPIDSISAPIDTGFESASQTLTAADFSLFSFVTGATTTASHPDFAGGIIQFGLVTIGQLSANTNADITFDHLRYQVSSLAQTPIPGGLPLMATALVGLGAFARRRKRNAA